MPHPGNPQSWNRYSYVLNNPLRYTDPSGHQLVEAVRGWGLWAFAAAVTFATLLGEQLAQEGVETFPLEQADNIVETVGERVIEPLIETMGRLAGKGLFWGSSEDNVETVPAAAPAEMTCGSGA